MGERTVFRPSDEEKRVLIDWLRECESHSYSLDDVVEVMSGPDFEIVDPGITQLNTNIQREIA